MFSVLSIAETKKRSLFARRRCSVEPILTAVRSGAPFLHVKVTASSKGIDWIKIAGVLGRSGRCTVAPESLELPQSAHIERFVPDVLPLKIMLNTAVKQLSGKSGALTRKLLVVDEKAVLAPYIDAVVPCAALIRVVTNEPELYYETSRRVMERYGASLLICAQVNSGERFDAAIAQTAQQNAKTVFAAELLGKEGFEVEVPEEYLRICPEGTDEFTFACALFECSGVRAIGELTAGSTDTANKDALPSE